MKKVMVIGANGMAGHILSDYLSRTGRHAVVNLCHGRRFRPGDRLVDVARMGRIEELIRRERPDAVVNCVGLLIRDSEEHPDRAALLNTWLPHRLEALLKGTRTKLIHLSTDCVFSGAKGGYREGDPMDGEGFYARSKALGEVVNGKDLTMRTSIIGPELSDQGTGLFHWFMGARGQVKGYRRVYWTGLTTLQLAKCVEAALGPRPVGLFHVVPKGKISKADLLELLAEVFGKRDVAFRPCAEPRSDKSLINTRRDFDFRVPGYRAMLVELKAWMADHTGLYSQYLSRS